MSRTGPLLLVYTLTIFVSALLLFLVQPLIGKLIVPLLGGFPAVWNTCMFFFQATLLAGYAYAHFSTAALGERKQAWLHLAVLLVPFVVLPLGIFTGLVPAGEDNPIPGLLLLLLASVGLPFFAISTTAPLLQRWFASTDHPAAQDPYFLYAASNAGSMIALSGYLALVEPNLLLREQRWAWTVCYALLVGLIAFCALMLWRSAPAAPAAAKRPSPKKTLAAAPEAITAGDRFRVIARDFVGTSLEARALTRPDDAISGGQVLRWVALAAVPSSLMLGATTYVTTDIAAIPLLWVLPLMLYLLSFIIVFSRVPAWVHKTMVLALPVLLLLLIFVMISKSKLPMPMWMTVLLHLVVLFAVAMVCHGELARTRPAAKHLTRFFLWMSVGGVVGGMFNAMLAPVVFNSLAEYPIAMVVAGLLLPRLDDERRGSTRSLLYDAALPVGLAILAVEAFNGFRVSNSILGSSAGTVVGWIDSVAETISVEGPRLRHILTYAPPVVLCYVFVERPLRFGLGLAVLLFASALPNVFDKQVVYRDRGFFGVLNVRSVQDAQTFKDAEGESHEVKLTEHRLLHGNILHGTQFRSDDDGDEKYRREPLTYYHRTGPIGQLLAAFEGADAKNDLAVIGLGTGTMAAYPEKGQRLTFYEIDRKVKWVSFDQDTYFSYVQDAKKRGAEIDVVLGDARLSLDRERASKPDQLYDVIVVDAFSSDAIPVHLITKQALAIYLDKLKPDGIVAFHTSNRYLRLEPVVGNIGDALRCAVIAQHDYNDGPPGKSSSSWALVAREKKHFGKLLEDVKADPKDENKRWEFLEPDDSVGVWSDDFSNLLKVFQWKSK